MPAPPDLHFEDFLFLFSKHPLVPYGRGIQKLGC